VEKYLNKKVQELIEAMKTKTKWIFGVILCILLLSATLQVLFGCCGGGGPF